MTIFLCVLLENGLCQHSPVIHLFSLNRYTAVLCILYIIYTVHCKCILYSVQCTLYSVGTHCTCTVCGRSLVCRHASRCRTVPSASGLEFVDRVQEPLDVSNLHQSQVLDILEECAVLVSNILQSLISWRSVQC